MFPLRHSYFCWVPTMCQTLLLAQMLWHGSIELFSQGLRQACRQTEGSLQPCLLSGIIRRGRALGDTSTQLSALVSCTLQSLLLLWMGVWGFVWDQTSTGHGIPSLFFFSRAYCSSYVFPVLQFFCFLPIILITMSEIISLLKFSSNYHPFFLHLFIDQILSYQYLLLLVLSPEPRQPS